MRIVGSVSLIFKTFVINSEGIISIFSNSLFKPFLLIKIDSADPKLYLFNMKSIDINLLSISKKNDDIIENKTWKEIFDL